jgi:cytochrome c-type biogenesis protein CcmH/NrfF
VLACGLSIPPIYADERTLEDPVIELSESVYCPCGCVRETIRACVCGTAQGITQEFQNRLRNEETIEEIREDYLGKYGTQFNAVMLAEGFNIVAYVIPFFILVVGLGIVAIVITRLKQGIREPAKTTSAKIDRAQFDYQQSEDEVERYKRD